MERSPNIDKALKVLRAQVCPTCRYRIAACNKGAPARPLPCEGMCPLFSNMDAIINTVEQLDPMIGDRKKLLRHLLATIGQIPVGKDKKHYRFGRRTVDVLDNVLPK